MPFRHAETHLIARIGWLRAAVLGANDGIISTASLMLGVAAAATSRGEVLTAGIAGLIAGAMSMAAGEYVSVSSQSDTERADLSRERRELAADPEGETVELAQIYTARGLAPDLARQVAEQLMARDAIGAHARDELGLSELSTAKPIQAAVTSAATFAAGAILPVIAAVLAPRGAVLPVVFLVALIVLAVLGAVGARAGGASILKPTLRVAFWGALAMGVTAAVGALVGHAV
ncbi:VIT1/CCC1 transporter family protein [Acidisoma sp. 7E03]